MKEKDQFGHVLNNSADSDVPSDTNEGVVRSVPLQVKRRHNKVSKSVSEMVNRLSEPLLSVRVKRVENDPATWYSQSSLDEEPRLRSFSVGNKTPEICIPEELTENLQDNCEIDPTKLCAAATYAESSDSDASSREDGNQLPMCTIGHNDGKVVADFTLQTDVYTLFNTVFSNSNFIKRLQAKRGITNAVMGEWTEDSNSTVRSNNYTVRLTVTLGPKHCSVSEKQVLLPISKPGYLYAVNMESNNSDVPHSDSFYLTFHLCLTRVSDTESRIMVVANMIYRKFPWAPIKAIIDKGTWAGIYGFYADFETILKEEFNTVSINRPITHNTENLTTNSITSSPVRRRPLRKKRPAPSIPTEASSKPSRNILTRGLCCLTETNSELFLKIFVCILALLLFCFNVFLFMKVQELETQFDEMTSNQFSSPLSYSVFRETDNAGDNFHTSFANPVETTRLEPIKSAIEKLIAAEKEIQVLKHFVLNNTHK